MKKLVSGLCAVSMLACGITALPAKGLFYDNGINMVFSLEEGQNGSAVLRTTDMQHLSFIAVTDSSFTTATTKDMIERQYGRITNTGNYKYWCGVDVAISSIKELEEKDFDYFAEEDKAIFSQYGSDVKYYRVYLNGKYLESLVEFSRHYMLMQDGVLDVILHKEDFSITNAQWEGFVELIPKDRYTSNTKYQELEEQFHVDEINEKLNQQYQIWQKQVTEWQSTIDTYEMSPKEIDESRKAAGIPTGYEMMQYAYQEVETVKAQYPELEEVASLQPSFSDDYEGYNYEFDILYHAASSAWDGIGDTNGDAEIDSSDASMILEYAAQAGTSAVTDSSVNAVMADVNTDGVVNALDASLVLAYSAQKGAGENISLYDICRNK